MRKLAVVSLLSCILALSPVIPVQAALGDSVLKVGVRSSDVIQLQTELNFLGYGVGRADGIYGSKTKAGVIAFQSAYHLKVDGIVGPQTVAALTVVYAAEIHNEKANAILATAKSYVGLPYRWGGTSPSTGFDCSGFIQYVFNQHGLSLPRVSRDQYQVGTPVSFDTLQPGDLLFFSIGKNGIVDHDGIYVGNGQFINASSSKGVTIYTIGPYWKSVYLGAKRVF